MDILRADTEKTTPDWLHTPGQVACGEHWPIVQAIYSTLTGAELPELPQANEWRKVDCILVTPDHSRILEVDETQHLNHVRALTLEQYASKIPLAFPAEVWIPAGEAKMKMEGGGLWPRAPATLPHSRRPPPATSLPRLASGRSAKRPSRLPTLRIADFETAGWFFNETAGKQSTNC